ncbi:hypothetical protein [Aestuariibaculum marinum]|uniref:DUF4083 domain-containing protein n=1 Tax=Aestuariibaculum marinum TaxID=2683592 RepID=A0A8J6PNU3_9FLAO|nr:hypothetical protein [Aestuariibaculum marinum]MBD0822604.1 hypothetical protein [Aestuariibaculum marinum]
MENLGIGVASIIMMILFFVIGVLVMRFIGAWMLRIDEVIKNQRILIEEIKKLKNND